MPPVAIPDDYSTTSSFSVKDPMAMKDAPPERRATRRRSVGFAPEPENKVLEFEPDEDAEQIWYTRDEYDIIKARNSLIIKMMKTGSFEETEEHTFRGLEHKLKDGFKQRRENKFNALNAVLEEQDKQYNRGIHEPEVIAKAYRRVSLNAAENAFVLACKDAESSYVGEAKHSPRSVGGLSEYMRNREDAEDNDDDGDVSEIGDDETDIDTVCTEDSTIKKTRLRKLFNGISAKRKDKMRRRTSM